MQEIRGVHLSEDEQVIREYEASYIAKPRTEGYIIATNRRLIFTGSSTGVLGNSIVVRETKIDTITGVISELNRGKSLAQIIFGIIISIIGLLMLSTDFLLFINDFVSAIILLIGGYMLYKAIKFPGVEMYLSILTSGQFSSAIQVAVAAKSGLFSKLSNNSAWLSVTASGPGANTEQLIREVGALIHDIQIMGDLAIEKWKYKPINNVPVAQPTYISDKVQMQVSNVTSTISNKVKEINQPQHNKVFANQTAPQDHNVFSSPSQPQQSVFSGYAHQAAALRCSCGNELEAGDKFCGTCGKQQ